MSLTTDRNNPDLGYGADESPVLQNKAYLVLSEEELAKGYIKPYRESYKHVGRKPKYPIRELTEEEHERYDRFEYVAYEEYPVDNDSSVVGRFWTQKDLDNTGCGTVTTMNEKISATYARDPWFYGSTYCCSCQMHRPLEEFVWLPDGEPMSPSMWTKEENERIAALRKSE